MNNYSRDSDYISSVFNFYLRPISISDSSTAVVVTVLFVDVLYLPQHSSIRTVSGRMLPPSSETRYAKPPLARRI